MAGTVMRSDVSCAVAVQLIRSSLEQFASSVKVKSNPASKTALVGRFKGPDGHPITLRYLVEGELIKGPNTDKFGASTRADMAVPQIEEDLYLNGAERVSAGRRYVTYRL